MKLKALETNCPVCGAKNAPIEVEVEIGNSELKVKAEYSCVGEIRRIFGRAKPCQTQYRIVLRGDAARRVESETRFADSESYGAREHKEG